MVKEIIWTKRAINKFNGIMDYLEAEWGEGVTRNFVVRTYEVIDLIALRLRLVLGRILKKVSEDFCSLSTTDCFIGRPKMN